jgi:hypothetical protein
MTSYSSSSKHSSQYRSTDSALYDDEKLSQTTQTFMNMVLKGSGDQDYYKEKTNGMQTNMDQEHRVMRATNTAEALMKKTTEIIRRLQEKRRHEMEMRKHAMEIDKHTWETAMEGVLTVATHHFLDTLATEIGTDISSFNIYRMIDRRAKFFEQAGDDSPEEEQDEGPANPRFDVREDHQGRQTANGIRKPHEIAPHARHAPPSFTTQGRNLPISTPRAASRHSEDAEGAPSELHGPASNSDSEGGRRGSRAASSWDAVD